MKKKELKLIIELMAQEINEQRELALAYRQERDMKAMELRKAHQELRGVATAKGSDWEMRP